MKKIFWSAVSFVSLCLTAILILSAVYFITGDKIAENSSKRELSYMKSLFPDAEDFTLLEEYQLNDGVGWVYSAGEQGYVVKSTVPAGNSDLVLVTGFEPGGDVTGIKILDKGDGSPYLGTLNYRDVYVKAVTNRFGGNNRINTVLDNISTDSFSAADMINGVAVAKSQIDIIAANVEAE